MFLAENAISAAESRVECLQGAQLDLDAREMVEEAQELIAEAKDSYDKGDYTDAASKAARAAMKLAAAANLYAEMTGGVLPCPDAF
jgi:hypothetical protein